VVAGVIGRRRRRRRRHGLFPPCAAWMEPSTSARAWVEPIYGRGRSGIASRKCEYSAVCVTGAPRNVVWDLGLSSDLVGFLCMAACTRHAVDRGAKPNRFRSS
jgi:hypothetical protein